jgi:hypothetical protein
MTRYELWLKAGVKPTGSLRAEGFRRCFRFLDLKRRSNRGGATGGPAREELRLDRSDPALTLETHAVDERREDGSC